MNVEKHDARVFEISYMPPETMGHYWAELEQRLDENPELWNTMYTKADIRDRIMDGRIQVWAVFNGRIIRLVFFTQRYVAPNGIATLQIFWMYGEGVREMLTLLDTAVDAFAAKLDCQRLEVVGRKGWERILAPLGAEYQCTVFSRPVRSHREN